MGSHIGLTADRLRDEVGARRLVLVLSVLALFALWAWQSVPLEVLARHCLETSVRLAIGVLSGVLISTFLILLLRRRVSESGALLSTLSFLDGIPTLAWLPVLLLLLPSEEEAVRTVAIIGGTLPLAIAVARGISQVDRHLEMSARLLGAAGSRLWFGVLVPAAWPAILAGLRTSMYQTARTVIGAEVLMTGSVGLGRLVAHDSQSADLLGICAIAALIGSMIALIDTFAFRRLQIRTDVKWQLRSVDQRE